MNRLIAILAGLSCAAIALRAEAQTRWLPDSPRAIPRSVTAHRDAPVLELSYGPRTQFSLGTERGILRWGNESPIHHLTLTLLLAGENPDSSSPLPSMAAHRDVESVSYSFAWMHGASTGEATMAIGHEGAGLSGEQSPVDPYRSTDIPFGGGGWFVAPDLGFSHRSEDWTIATRIGDRVFLNAFPAWVGRREASNHVADALSEGLLHAPFADVVLRYRARDALHAVTALSGEAMFAHDDSARDGALLRWLAGVVIEGEQGETWPFVAFEAGNGKGMFINRRELRLALGVRYVL